MFTFRETPLYVGSCASSTFPQQRSRKVFTLTDSLSTHLFTLRRAVFTFSVTFDVFVNVYVTRGVDSATEFALDLIENYRA